MLTSDDLELILLPLPSDGLDYRCELPHPVMLFWGFYPRLCVCEASTLPTELYLHQIGLTYTLLGASFASMSSIRT